MKSRRANKRFNVAKAFLMFRRGCLKLMKHHIAINFDARFIALQDHCCGDNVFAQVQEGSC
jgi:hypothetical protein